MKHVCDLCYQYGCILRVGAVRLVAAVVRPEDKHNERGSDQT